MLWFSAESLDGSSHVRRVPSLPSSPFRIAAMSHHIVVGQLLLQRCTGYFLAILCRDTRVFRESHPNAPYVAAPTCLLAEPSGAEAGLRTVKDFPFPPSNNATANRRSTRLAIIKRKNSKPIGGSKLWEVSAFHWSSPRIDRGLAADQAALTELGLARTMLECILYRVAGKTIYT